MKSCARFQSAADFFSSILSRNAARTVVFFTRATTLLSQINLYTEAGTFPLSVLRLALANMRSGQPEAISQGRSVGPSGEQLASPSTGCRPTGARWGLSGVLCPAGRVTLVKVGRPGHVTRSGRGRGSVAAGRSVDEYRCCRALRV